MKVRFLLFTILFAILFIGCSIQENNEIVYTGFIEGDEIDISTEVSGVLNDILVHEGESIKEGDLIAKVDTKSLSLQLKQVEAELKMAEAQLDKIKAGARSEEIRKAEVSLEEVKVLLEGAKDEYEYRLKNYNKINDLYKNSGASEQQVRDAKALLDSSYTKVQSLEKKYLQSKTQLELLLNGPTVEELNIAKAKVESINAKIELLKYQISKGDVVSTVDGVIQTINYNKGELVSAGSNIATIVDLNNLWVKIYVPQKELHKVSLNQEVLLTLDYKDKKIRGKVVYISPEAEFTPRNVESKESKEELVFAVKIKLIDKLSELKPGMLVDVHLDGDVK
ncbi:HlyD family secretion protein [Caloranaerobacter ferrireducens]|uniref:HlyD family secretion protein n=1 Tax=Caloranaerobacter ferrireducens TaxID=1323370 RepID=UPI00084DB6D4|nr:HlyD family efflux transporter periplasmic adaptor subunit [Caloranaerobacter ferrireducens]